MNTVKINLLPPDIKKKRTAEKGFVLLIGVLVIIIGICSFVTIVLILKASTETRALDDKKMEIAGIDKQMEEFGVYKDRQRQVKIRKTTLDEIMGNEVYWHKFMNEISMVIPPDVNLDSLKLSETGSITLTGSGFEYETVSEFLIRLNDLDMIKDVWLQGVNTGDLAEVKTIGQDGDTADQSSTGNSSEEKVSGVSFSIVAKLKNPVVEASKQGEKVSSKSEKNGST